MAREPAPNYYFRIIKKNYRYYLHIAYTCANIVFYIGNIIHIHIFHVLMRLIITIMYTDIRGLVDALELFICFAKYIY